MKTAKFWYTLQQLYSFFLNLNGISFLYELIKFQYEIVCYLSYKGISPLYMLTCYPISRGHFTLQYITRTFYPISRGHFTSLRADILLYITRTFHPIPADILPYITRAFSPISRGQVIIYFA